VAAAAEMGAVMTRLQAAAAVALVLGVLLAVIVALQCFATPPAPAPGRGVQPIYDVHQAAPPAREAESAAALAMLVPQGNGTLWCLRERTCREDGGGWYAFRFFFDGPPPVTLCLDLIPCDPAAP
jgi:hypothetical protein